MLLLLLLLLKQQTHQSLNRSALKDNKDLVKLMTDTIALTLQGHHDLTSPEGEPWRMSWRLCCIMQ